MTILHKIIEWDKQRKFGHTFGDFLFMLLFTMILNVVVCLIANRIVMPVLIISTIIYVIIVNRKSPDK